MRAKIKIMCFGKKALFLVVTDETTKIIRCKRQVCIDSKNKILDLTKFISGGSCALLISRCSVNAKIVLKNGQNEPPPPILFFRLKTMLKRRPQKNFETRDCFTTLKPHPRV